MYQQSGCSSTNIDHEAVTMTDMHHERTAATWDRLGNHGHNDGHSEILTNMDQMDVNASGRSSVNTSMQR